MDVIEVIDKVIAIRDRLPQESSNKIDCSLNPVPPFCGKSTIKLIILGQDPTIGKQAQRSKIRCTLNLDKTGPLREYIKKICEGLDLSLDNIYATNLYKYFYTLPPAKTLNVLEHHLTPNLELLKSEISDFEKCPIITLGEPVLKLLANTNKKVRNHWNYEGCGSNYNNDNKLQRLIFPFPHQPTMSMDFYRVNFNKYLDYMKQILSIL